MSLFNLFKKKTRIEEEIPNQIPKKELSTAELKKQIQDNKKYHQEKFVTFVFSIQDNINLLKTHLSISEMKYDIDEIIKIEEFHLKHFKNPELIDLNTTKLNDLYRSYIGTAILWHLGGEWDVCLNEKYSYYGDFFIIEYGGKDYTSNSINIDDWRIDLEKNGIEDGAHKVINRFINYFNLSPEYRLNPIRNIK